MYKNILIAIRIIPDECPLLLFDCISIAFKHVSNRRENIIVPIGYREVYY